MFAPLFQFSRTLYWLHLLIHKTVMLTETVQWLVHHLQRSIVFQDFTMFLENKLTCFSDYCDYFYIWYFYFLFIVCYLYIVLHRGYVYRQSYPDIWQWFEQWRKRTFRLHFTCTGLVLVMQINFINCVSDIYLFIISGHLYIELSRGHLWKVQSRHPKLTSLMT